MWFNRVTSFQIKFLIVSYLTLTINPVKEYAQITVNYIRGRGIYGILTIYGVLNPPPYPQFKKLHEEQSLSTDVEDKRVCQLCGGVGDGKPNGASRQILYLYVLNSKYMYNNIEGSKPLEATARQFHFFNYCLKSILKYLKESYVSKFNNSSDLYTRYFARLYLNEFCNI